MYLNAFRKTAIFFVVAMLSSKSIAMKKFQSNMTPNEIVSSSAEEILSYPADEVTSDSKVMTRKPLAQFFRHVKKAAVSAMLISAIATAAAAPQIVSYIRMQFIVDAFQPVMEKVLQRHSDLSYSTGNKYPNHPPPPPGSWRQGSVENEGARLLIGYIANYGKRGQPRPRQFRDSNTSSNQFEFGGYAGDVAYATNHGKKGQPRPRGARFKDN